LRVLFRLGAGALESLAGSRGEGDMKKAFAVVVVLALGGCVPSQAHPLSVSAKEGRALFSSLAACASARQAEAVQHPDSVNVRAVPGAWAQFMAQGERFQLVVVVEDASGGPQVVQERAAAAKKVGDEIFSCALAAGPMPPPASPAVPASPSTPPDPAPSASAAAAPAPSPAPPAASPSAPAGSASVAVGGSGKNPMDGFGRALGGAFGTMSDCTRLTACRTQLSGEVCLAADKPCLDAINGGDSGGPQACGKNLARVREAAERYKRRPDWKLPDACK